MAIPALKDYGEAPAPLITNEDAQARYKRIVGRDRYFKLKSHPEFPRPVIGKVGKGCKQIFSLAAVDSFFQKIATGEIDAQAFLEGLDKGNADG